MAQAIQISELISLVVGEMNAPPYELDESKTVYSNFKLFLDFMSVNPITYEKEVIKFCNIFEPKFDKLNIPFFSTFPQHLPLPLKNDILNYINSIFKKLLN
jgi:hypothetical protein